MSTQTWLRFFTYTPLKLSGLRTTGPGALNFPYTVDATRRASPSSRVEYIKPAVLITNLIKLLKLFSI